MVGTFAICNKADLGRPGNAADGFSWTVSVCSGAFPSSPFPKMAVPVIPPTVMTPISKPLSSVSEVATVGDEIEIVLRSAFGSIA